MRTLQRTLIAFGSPSTPVQEVAAKARAHLEGLADLYATPAREAELIVIFKEATRLEADFWEMGWRADQRVE
jgi:thiaminase (transcriptional activator TenA)